MQRGAQHAAVGHLAEDEARDAGCLRVEQLGVLVARAGHHLEAGAADGTVRSDVAADDVMRVMWGVRLVPDGPDWDAQVRRLLDLVVDGLRFRA